MRSAFLALIKIFQLFFLFDFVEFSVHLKKFFFCEGNSGHAHKSGKAKKGKTAHHVHNGFFINVKTCGTFSAGKTFFD